MPKPKIGGGAPASRSVGEHRSMVEAHGVVRPGHAGAGHAIGVAAAEPRRCRASRSRGVLAAAISTGATPCAAGRGGEGRGLEQRHVGDQHAVDAGRGGVAGRKRPGPRASDEIGVGEDADRNVADGGRGSRASRRSSRRASRPRASARTAAAWITGPSATGSEKGMPTSIMSAPPSTSASRMSALVSSPDRRA